MSDRLEELRAALAGRYEIERELGQGGMAAVYLANDVKHQRQVAVKVLRPDLAAALGPDRFLREIRIAANLNHPHIMALFDSGETDGFLYYVMPYIRGQTLRDRLDREGELPITETVRIIREITDALAFAHAEGVVHRDIKPDNVMLAGGHAIVADFGVAKAVTEAAGRDNLTTAGVALGTPSYMAPEQATADPHVDHRADIYAVGAMAYELLAGRTPFAVPNAQAILAAHLTQQVDPVSKYRDQVSGELEAVIMKCLAKKPADRWQTASEMLPYLESLATSSGGLTPASTVPVTAVSGPKKLLNPMVVGGVAGLVLIGVFGAKILTPASLEMTTSNSRRVTRAPGLEFQPTISPDGREVAYVEGPIGAPTVVIRSTIDVGSRAEIRPLQADGNQWYPRWSAQGEMLSVCVYTDSCSWQEVSRMGGGAATRQQLPRHSSRNIFSHDGSRGAFAWGDSLLAYATGSSDLVLLGVQVVEPWSPHSLAWSPDDRWIAYVNGNQQWRNSGNVSNSSIWIISADGGEPVQITTEDDANLSPQWLPDSRHLLFVSDRDGARAMYLVRVGSDGASGTPTRVAGGEDAHSISISRDGRRLAFAKFAVSQNIWSVPISTDGPVRLSDALRITNENQVIETHDVSRDGSWLAFDSDRRGNMDIYRMDADGDTPTLLVDMDDNVFEPVISPDGSEVVFYGSRNQDLWIVPASGGTPTRLTSFPGFDNGPNWAPDGLALAFSSEGPAGSGGSRVWVTTRDSVGGTWSEHVQITAFQCSQPDWSETGETIACDAGPEIAIVTRTGAEVTRLAQGMNPGRPTFSADDAHVYFLGSPENAPEGVWSVPVSGGEAPSSSNLMIRPLPCTVS